MSGKFGKIKDFYLYRDVYLVFKRKACLAVLKTVVCCEGSVCPVYLIIIPVLKASLNSIRYDTSQCMKHKPPHYESWQ